MRLLTKIILTPAIALLFFVFAKHSVEAASYSFNPSAAAFIQGCTNEVIVQINTAGANSNSADIRINYDPARIQIVDADPGAAGVQVENGDAYQAYVYNLADNGTGLLRVAAASFIGPLNGTRTFIKIQFESVGASVNGGFTIDFTGVGDTLDSNIAEQTSSNDLLTSVTNGSYTFSSGSCIADTTPPNITYNSPTNNAQNIPANANISLTVSDSSSGVDISTVVVTVNGVPYDYTSPQFTYSGSPSSYTITIDPVAGIPQGTASTVSTIASDLAGNTTTRIITFNIPQIVITPAPTQPPVVGDTTPPVIIPEDPLEGGLLPNDGNITIKLTDSGSGVSIGKMILILNGVQFIYNNPAVDYSGNPSEYQVILDPPGLLTGNSAYLVIYAEDASGNAAFKTVYYNLATTPTPTPTQLPDTGCQCTVSPTPVVVNNVPVELENLYNGINLVSPDFLDTFGGLPGLVSAATAGVSAIAWINFAAIPGFLALIFTKGNQKPWGIVYNQENGEPVFGSTVKLRDFQNGDFIAESVTDLHGRFEFNLENVAAQYKVCVDCNGFADAEFVIDTHQDARINYIGLTKQQLSATGMLTNIFNKILKFVQKENLAVAIFGLTMSIVSFAFFPGLANTILTVYYLIWVTSSTFFKFSRI